MTKDKDILNELKDFLKHNGGDCPTDLIGKAKTKWQKSVAIEFVKLYKDILEIKTEQKWLKWLIVSVFGVTILGLLSQWMPILLG